MQNEMQEELEYFERVKRQAEYAIDNLSKNAAKHKDEFYKLSYDVGSNYSNMDKQEKIINQTFLSYQDLSIREDKSKLEMLSEFKKSPYFGSINFECAAVADEFPSNKIYIGKFGFITDNNDIWVVDWRAAIASIFYEYNEGSVASYTGKNGITFEGYLSKKKQYRFENGELMLHDLGGDNILQKELGHSANDKMKDIVATIQREQNEIIRSEYPVMVVQGAAGSGKTSVALHRIAYLLYRFRKTINSSNIMILSPNSIFSYYISNVLPDLGEIKTAEITFYDFVKDELGNIYTVESPGKQNARILADKDAEKLNSLKYKLSAEFFQAMVEFIENFAADYMTYGDISEGNFTVKEDDIKFNFEYKRSYITAPYFKRFENIVKTFAAEIENSQHIQLERTIRQKLVAKMKNHCLPTDDILEIYNEFLNVDSKKKGLKLGVAEKKNLKLEDAVPLLYFKLAFEGLSAKFDSIKYVVIDEMQDYSYIHFEIIKQLFPKDCQMTILGDINQVIVRPAENVLEILKKLIPNAHFTEINKTYRSTFEITTFASKLAEIKNIEPFMRHGQTPEITACSSHAEEITKINEICRLEKGSTAIICKTVEQAELIYNELKEENFVLNLCVKEDSALKKGITIITAFLSKGLEFDAVIIPDVDAQNFADSIDRQILYISATRTLHRLYLLYSGEKSLFLH